MLVMNEYEGCTFCQEETPTPSDSVWCNDGKKRLASLECLRRAPTTSVCGASTGAAIGSTQL